MNAAELLRRRKLLKKPNGELFYVYFRYKRLVNFRFYCGYLDHVEKTCLIMYELADKEDIDVGSIERPYEALLRAPLGRRNLHLGNQFLREDFFNKGRMMFQTLLIRKMALLRKNWRRHIKIAIRK